MKKTFTEFLTEIDWDELGDPSGLSPEQRRKAMHVASSQPASEIRPRSQADRMRAAAGKLGAKADSQRAYAQGPAINDIKIAWERVEKVASTLDSMAGHLENRDGTDELIKDIDEAAHTLASVEKSLEQIWQFFAVGGKYGGRR